MTRKYTTIGFVSDANQISRVKGMEARFVRIVGEGVLKINPWQLIYNDKKGTFIMNKKLIIAIGIVITLLFFLNIVDYVLTVKGIQTFGIEEEGNKFIKKLYSISPLVFLFFKGCVGFLLIHIFRILKRVKKPIQIISLIALSLVSLFYIYATYYWIRILY